MLLLLLVVAPSLLIFASSSVCSSLAAQQRGFLSLLVVPIVVCELLWFFPFVSSYRFTPPLCTTRGFFHFTVHFVGLAARRQRARESYKITSPSLCASTKRTNRANKHRVYVQHTAQHRLTARHTTGISRRPKLNEALCAAEAYKNL